MGGAVREHQHEIPDAYVREPLIFDAWTPISFKRHFGSRRQVGEGAGFKPPDWIGPEHLRRLQAYGILRAYQDNAGREFFAGSRAEIHDRREYGEAALLVETVVGALLGEDQQILTEGAEELSLEEENPDSQTDPAEIAARDAAVRAVALQEFLEQWAQDERLGLKMLETERLAVGLGDGVFSLGWSGQKGRPRLRVWDPTFYFPVLTDTNEDDYPEKVHIAWEVDDPETRNRNKTKIRRITWELGPIEPDQGPGIVQRALGRGAAPIERQYAWNDGPSTVTCYYTDATWLLEAGNKSVDDLTESDAVYELDEDNQEIKRQDLQIDFLPVVHIPNTVALLNHYGRSTLSTVLQILDDISSADTDLSAASATTGHPIITLQGASAEKDAHGRSTLRYRPGEVLESGDGKMDVLDTSKALDALIGYIEFLLKRLSVNSRVSEGLLGRVKASEVPSGIALALSFGPTDQLIRSMRLVRSEKYPLLLKFAHRMFLAGQAAGQITDVPAEWIHTEITMGSFLPQDQQAAVTQVTALYAAHAISLETAITMLIEASIPIQNVLEEVQRIQERDFAAAADLFTATGDQDLVYEFLGRTPPPPDPAPPAVTVVPGNQPIPPNPGADPTLFGPDGQPLQ
jgi:hypothetical protein